MMENEELVIELSCDICDRESSNTKDSLRSAGWLIKSDEDDTYCPVCSKIIQEIESETERTSEEPS